MPEALQQFINVPPNQLWISSNLTSMFGVGVEVEVAPSKLVTGQLFSEEREYVARAVPKRQNEFSTARVCARRALSRLGVRPCCLVPNPDRSPRWPRGIVGSISHTNNWCAVAVTDSVHITGLGLDIEQSRALQPELESLICTDIERQWLDRQEEAQRGHLRTIFFSAKEAIYKCQYTSTQTTLDFKDVTLDIDLLRHTFCIADIALKGEIWDLIQHTRGKFCQDSYLTLTTAVLQKE